MPHYLPALLLSVGAYLLGSVLTAPLVCRLFALPDPRSEGSLNPGATNVYRLGGRIPAAVTLALDAGKGALPVILARALELTPVWQVAVGLCAICGHMLPLYSGFRGGKGVATALGAGLVLAPQTTFILSVIWLVIVWRWRISALASITAAVLGPVISLWLEPQSVLLFLLMGLLILVRHRSNLIRLWRGNENRF